MTNPSINRNVMTLMNNGLKVSGNSANQSAYQALLAYINNPPVLINQLNGDVDNALVKSFAWSQQAVPGFFFDANNGADSLNISISQLLQSNPYQSDSYEEIFVIGHELDHAEFQVSNATDITPSQAMQTFANQIDQAINSGTQDFTSAIQTVQSNSNYNESNASTLGAQK